MAASAPDLPMEFRAHDLELYTDAYKQRASRAEAFRGSLRSWHRFAESKPLLYLPARASNADFDPRDRRRYLWTHEELNRFGDVVETRTRELLDAQEQLLRSWHRAATQIEKIVRGFVARRRVKKLLEAITNAANQLERAKLLVWLLKRQIAAAVLFQRAYRRHVAHLAFVESCRVRLQRSTRLLLFRLHRLRATCKIQRAFRCHRYRSSVLSHLRKLCRMLQAGRRKQRLDELTLVVSQAREQTRKAQQELLWERHPEKMAQLQRVQQRKEEIANVAATALPLLAAAKQQRQSKPRCRSKASAESSRMVSRKSLNQIPSLPSLQKKSGMLGADEKHTTT